MREDADALAKAALRIAMVLGVVLGAYGVFWYQATVGKKKHRTKGEKAFVALVQPQLHADERFQRVGFLRDHSDQSNVLIVTGKVTSIEDEIALKAFLGMARTNFGVLVSVQVDLPIRR